MNRVAGMVGVPLAGVLMAIWSAPVVLLMDAASFLVAAALIAVFVDPSAEPPRSERPEGGPGPVAQYVGELREGFGFLRRDRLLVAIGVLILVTNLLDQAYGAVLVPVWVRDQLGSPLGLGLIGGRLRRRRRARIEPVRLARTETAAHARPSPGGSSSEAPRGSSCWRCRPPCHPCSPSRSSRDSAWASINPALSSVEFERIPRHLQARVLGALGAVAWAGMPVGALLGGYAVETLGLTRTLAVRGLTTF